jgi:hypothetical protein
LRTSYFTRFHFRNYSSIEERFGLFLRVCIFVSSSLQGLPSISLSTCMLTWMSIMEVTHFRGPNVIFVSQYDQLTVQLSIERLSLIIVSLQCSVSHHGFMFSHDLSQPKSFSYVQDLSHFQFKWLTVKVGMRFFKHVFLWFVRILHICSYIL